MKRELPPAVRGAIAQARAALAKAKSAHRPAGKDLDALAVEGHAQNEEKTS